MWTMANRLYVKSGGACNSGHLEKRKVNFSLQNEKAPDIIELMVHRLSFTQEIYTYHSDLDPQF